jgi:hypothetical protein
MTVDRLLLVLAAYLSRASTSSGGSLIGVVGYAPDPFGRRFRALSSAARTRFLCLDSDSGERHTFLTRRSRECRAFISLPRPHVWGD